MSTKQTVRSGDTSLGFWLFLAVCVWCASFGPRGCVVPWDSAPTPPPARIDYTQPEATAPGAAPVGHGEESE